MGFALFPKDLKYWKVVVVSFLTAATFWFFNSLNKNYTTSLNYPVEYAFNKDSLVSVRPLPSEIGLDVSGGGWNLLRRTAIFNPLPLLIDLSDKSKQSSFSWVETLPSLREQIQDLTINQVLSDTMRVQIEPIQKKWVRPVIDSVGIKLEESFRLISRIDVSQDSILITGPKSYLDTMSSVYLVNIQDEEIDKDFDGLVNVVSSFEEIVKASPPEIDASFRVDRFNYLQMDVPVEKSNFPTDSSAVLSLDKVLVRFVVQESMIENYAESDFIVITDYNMMRKSDSTVLAVLTAYPLEVSEVQMEPEIIKVIFR